MGARFLSLASQGGTSEPSFFLFGPMMVLLIIVLIVLAVCVAVLIHFARRRLIDDPAGRKHTDFADPWTEAGRRIGEAKPGARPTNPPPPTGGGAGDGAS